MKGSPIQRGTDHRGAARSMRLGRRPRRCVAGHGISSATSTSMDGSPVQEGSESCLG